MSLASACVALDGPARRLSTVILLSAFALTAQAQDKCLATGRMGSETFALNHCAAALYGSQHSVAIWFNQDSISPQEVRDFEGSATVEQAKDGRQRTLVLISFCPGGGGATALPASVKSVRLTTNHAKSPLVGIQWTVKAPKDFKVQKLSGEIKPGGSLAGKMAGSWRKTSFNLDFAVTLPTRESDSGVDCGK